MARWNGMPGPAWTIVAVASCLAIGNEGCGGDEAQGSTPDASTTDTGVLTRSSFCDGVAAGICTQLLPCCNSLDAGSDYPSCVARATASCQAEATLPNTTFDPVAAARCVGFYQNATGNLTVVDCQIVNPATSTTCADVIEGTLPPGSPCTGMPYAGMECGGADAGAPLCTVFPDGGSACSVVPYAGRGQSCAQTLCRAPLECNHARVCVLPGPVGASCTEAADCTSANCSDAGCAPPVPVPVTPSFCAAYSVTRDGG